MKKQELTFNDLPQNIAIFGMITHKDVDTGDIFYDKVSFCEIVKPREPEKPGGGASIWKRDPVGTFLRYLKSRYIR